MYKVLFVDDEPMSIEVLKMIVDWEKLGFLPCGECNNGFDALREIEIHSPDLVITDIRMPVMDGLDLIDHIINKGIRKINFIILSGYSEFEYAKRAMQYGISHYILKPIVEEEVIEVLQDIRYLLDEQLRETENKRIDREAVLHDFLSRIMMGDIDERVVTGAEALLGPDAIDWTWHCILAEIELSENDNESLQNHLIQNEKVKTIKILQEVANQLKDAYVIDLSDNIISILVAKKNQIDSSHKYQQVANLIFQSFENVLTCKYTIAEGMQINGIKNIRKAYTSAIEALNYKFFRGTGSLIYHKDIKPQTLNYTVETLKIFNKIIEEFDNKNVNHLDIAIEELFENFAQNHTAPEIVRMFVMDMLYQSIRIISQRNGNAELFAKKYSVFELENRKLTLPELQKNLKDCAKGCNEYLKELRNRSLQGSFYKIHEYILENFRRNITIRELAQHMYLHPVYLGQLIFKKMGINFNEYLHKLRIEEAMLLIETTNKKTHEIAEEVGYLSYNHFLQQFEKYSKLNPGEYKNKLLQVKQKSSHVKDK